MAILAALGGDAVSLYWSRLACASCKVYGERGRACPDHALYGEGYEAGFEAAMRSLVKPKQFGGMWPASMSHSRPWIMMAPGGLVLKVGTWVEGKDGQRFATEAEAQAAIATAPRWWPKQPWEVE